MNIKQIEYFITVADTLNFTKAAEILYVSQSAITKQILSLEEELGVKLLNRTKKEVTLTSAGDIFLNQAYHILSKINETKKIMKSVSLNESSFLRIGYVNGLEKTKMIDIIYTFYKLNPACSLIYDNDLSYSLQKKLLNNQLDIILTYKKLENTDYDNIEILESSMMLYVSKNSQYVNKTYIEEKELKELNLLYNPLDNLTSKNVLLTLDHMLLQVIGNKNSVVLPSYAIQYSQFRKYVTGIPIKGKKETIYAIYKKDKKNKYISSFIKLFHQDSMKNA